jgi:uncharacterized protein (TIGR03437 family)
MLKPLFKRQPRALRLSIILSAALLWSHGSASAQQDRIAGRIGGHGTVALKGNLSPKASPQYDQGRVDPDLKMGLVTLTFKPSPAQQTALNALLTEQQDRSSPNYHHWITPEQYASQFGLSQGDIDRVVSWLQSNSLKVDYPARGRNWIAFSGTARNMELAFGAEIHRYRVGGETHFANSTDPSLPSDLADVVLAVRGLDDFRMKPPAIRTKASSDALRSVSGHPEYTFSNGNHALAPDDLAVIYDIAPLYANGTDGSGQQVVVAGQSDIALADIATFRKNILPANVPQVVLVPGSADPGITAGQIEADLDLEWIGAVARNATITYVNSTDVLDSANYAISENFAPVLSYSFGACEQDLTSATTQAIETIAKQANAQGITLVAASGDEGAAACDSGAQATHGLAVLFPASLPEVTGVGGTEFSEGAGAWWSSSNSSTLESALAYIPEIAWNDSGIVGHLAASGGGVSTLYSKPAWQAGPGVPNDGARDVPDVAMDASAQHDPYIVVSGGALSYEGGTSAATPVFAGLIALLNQYSGSKGEGNINPNLYRIPQTNAFHDIVSGSNVVTCGSGTPDCSSGSFGYVAGTGYDQVTGLGSVDARNLIVNWNAATPASHIVVTCSPDPVYEQQANSQGFSWFYTITLTETAGVATNITGFTVNGTSYTSQLAAYFGTTTIAAGGTLSASIEEENVPVPTNLVFVFTGVDAGGHQWSQQLSVPFYGPQTAGAAPTITPNGVVPIYSSATTIQQGEWVSIYGTNLGPTPAAMWAGNFPQSLGGTSVTIDGKPAYLLYVSASLINLQVPNDTKTGPVNVVVTTAGGSVTSTVTLAAFAPSFLLFDGKHVTGIIIRSDGSGSQGGGTYDFLGPTGNSLGYPTVAAKAGDSVQLYAVGLGPTNPPIVAGKPLTVNSAPTINPVTLHINNVSITPGFAGFDTSILYQINLTIPAGLGTGDVPLSVTVAGAQTQSGVYISLQ